MAQADRVTAGQLPAAWCSSRWMVAARWSQLAWNFA